MRKIISAFALVSLLITTNLGFTQTFAVETNSQVNPWTMEKARHLAKRALFGVTKEDVQQLFDVGSAQNAVNVLFPSRNGPNKTEFNNKLSTITNDPDFNPADRNDMYEYYLAKRLYDPYEAKAKLFLLFEDIFAVNTSGSKNITYMDIENTHDLVYNEMFGDYKTLVKKSLYNNGGTGDYSISQFLDLLNQSNPARPNENYARELVQLLLMGEYIPGESGENGDIRNYSETDVAALAKILVGFESNENTHQVTFNPTANTNQTVEFLELHQGDTVNFPFYDNQTGEIDIQLLKNPINGNNGLPDNTIDYIFAQRSEEISLFIADRLFRYYVSETPTRNELNQISTQLLSNDFDIYTTTKWLLSNDMMYSTKSMNELRYKNPVELIIGTKKILGVDDPRDFRNALSNIGWTPYFPGSIFGRDGFDENKEFFNATSVIEWSYEVSKIIDKADLESMLDNNLTLQENISGIENKLLTEERLTDETRQQLIDFMSKDEQGNEIPFEPNDSDYNKKYTHGLLYFILTQPEYILQSGMDIPSRNNEENKDFYGNDNKLVIIKFRGGFDWLHGVIPKDEYNTYLENRGDGSLERNELLEIGDYYINAKMSDFKDLYDSGNLKIFNRVGTPKHSRAHDTASRMMASAYNQGGLEAPGILGEFIENENPLKTVQLGGDKGLVFRGGQYLTIGRNGLFRIQDSTDTNFRIHKLNTLKEIYNNRFYPENLDFVFKNGVYIGNVAENSVANGGRSGAGYNMQDNLSFAENLFDGGVTNVVRIAADGGYDTHGRQKENLSNNLERVASRTADFFNRVKDKHNVTIVLYSEFGRTLKINSSMGTDHGKGGGMFVLTNNQELQTEVPQKIIGNNSFENAQANRLGVGIDYRAVYKKLYETLYNQDISETLGGDFELSNYLNTTTPDPKLFRTEYQREGSRVRAYLKFRIDDENYFHTQGSHIRFSYGSNSENLNSQSRYTIDRYMVESDKELKLYMRNLSENTEYFYKIEIFDNQYNSRVVTGSIMTPDYKNSNENILETNKNTFLSQYNNTIIENKLILTTPISLSLSGSTTYQNDNIQLISGSGTSITELTGSTGSIWNGGFIVPTEVNKDSFISILSNYNNTELIKFKNIEKIIHVGSDTLGVGMNLSNSVDIRVNNLTSGKKYGVLSTQDGIDWQKVEDNNIIQNNTNLTIKTNHFSYFAIVELDNNGDFIVNDSNSNNNNGGSNKSQSGGGGSLTKDKCKYGDFSPSYYDKTCGKTLTAKEIYKISHSYTLKNNLSYNIENDLINNAIDELEQFDSKKSKIFYEIFDSVNAQDKEQQKVLKILRQDITTMKVGDYDIYYIQGYNKNGLFKKLVEQLIRKNYKDQYEQNLIESVNNLILTLGLRDNSEISESTKSKIKNVLSNKVQSLKFHYKRANMNKKVVKAVLQPKNIQDNSGNKQSEAYYRTRKEEIIKKLKQK